MHKVDFGGKKKIIYYFLIDFICVHLHAIIFKTIFSLRG